MTASDKTFAETLTRDDKGRIIFTYRGHIERGVGGSYKWFDGYSATTLDGGVLYPWTIKRDCHKMARGLESKAVFEQSRVGFAA